MGNRLPHRLRQEDGSALLACMLIAIMFAASVIWYSEWSRVGARGKVHRMGTRVALDAADTGINDALIRLKSPALKNFLDIGQRASYSIAYDRGRIDLDLVRQSPDANLVEITSTAYWWLPKGGFIDPTTGRAAQRSIVQAKYRVTNVGQFLTAVPTNLKVGYGTSAADGMIYANQLQFQGCSAGPCLTPTTLRSAYFYESCTSTAPLFVQFTGDPKFAQRLSYPMNFATLDPNMRQFYQRLGEAIGPQIQGAIQEPLPTHVYFRDGDLDIGTAGPVTVHGLFVIYVTGRVRIHNNIFVDNADSWLGVLSEKEIHLASDAPNNLTINGNFVCNGTFTGDPLPSGVDRTDVNLLIRGGIVSLALIDIAPHWLGTRTYTYHTVDSNQFLLPNLTQPLEYKVTGGKFD
jgi:hypothetical protein